MEECLIIMPISTPESALGAYEGDADHFRHVLECLFLPAIEKAGLTAVQPIAEAAVIIHADIIRKIETCDLVLCDMSSLNPNVFFELGIRIATGKPVCLVVDECTKDVPFDLSIVNYHRYEGSLRRWVTDGEVDRLAMHIERARRGGPHNQLWQYFGLTKQADFSESDGGLGLRIGLLNDRLDTMMHLMSIDRFGAARTESRVLDPAPWGAASLRNWIMDALGARSLVPTSDSKGKRVFLAVTATEPSAELAREVIEGARDRGVQLRIQVDHRDHGTGGSTCAKP